MYDIAVRRTWIPVVVALFIQPTSIAAQVIQVRSGQVTSLSVAPVEGASYRWSVYENGRADFATEEPRATAGARFVNAVTDQPSVKIQFTLPGIYFIKTLIINSDGCSNFRITPLEAVQAWLEATAFPNPVVGNVINFRVKVSEESLVTIDLYSSEDELISRIHEAVQPAGADRVVTWRWYLPQGLYSYRIRAGDQSAGGYIISVRVY